MGKPGSQGAQWSGRVIGGVMYCTECGKPLVGEQPKFCAACGALAPIENTVGTPTPEALPLLDPPNIAGNGQTGVEPTAARENAETSNDLPKQSMTGTYTSPAIYSATSDASNRRSSTGSTLGEGGQSPATQPPPASEGGPAPALTDAPRGTVATPPVVNLSPQGWYRDPYNSGRRWWSGSRWNTSKWDTKQHDEAIRGGTAPPPHAESAPGGNAARASAPPPVPAASPAQVRGPLLSSQPVAPYAYPQGMSRTSKTWLFVGLGFAAVLVIMVIIGSLEQGRETPVLPQKTNTVTDGLAEAQARWDGSDYMQQQATCAAWRSYSHDEFFSINPLPIEGRPMMTTLLNRNC